MVVASAPGKVLWVGAYALSEKGNRGFVTSVEARVYAKATELPFPNVEIISQQLQINESGKFANGKITIADERAKFVKNAIENTLNYLSIVLSKSKNGSSRLKGVKLETYSDEAFSVEGAKSGLGSSAAVTVATVAAVLALHDVDFENSAGKEVVHKLAQFAHCTSQGKVGSGFDVAAGTFGAIEYSRFSPELISVGASDVVNQNWDYFVKPMQLPRVFTAVIANIPNTSTSTTKMMAGIKPFKEKHLDEYNALFAKLNEHNKTVLNALRALTKGTESLQEFRIAFDASRSLVKKLGEKSGVEIESNAFSELIEDSKQHGAFVALLPGAGGGDAIAALCLSARDASRLKSFWNSRGLQVLNISTSDKGVKLENSFPLDGVVNKSRN
ncbi:MAG: hypothetical protein V1722_03420 [Candidatus Micrarchaeota archaeon]